MNVMSKNDGQLKISLKPTLLKLALAVKFTSDHIRFYDTKHNYYNVSTWSCIADSLRLFRRFKLLHAHNGVDAIVSYFWFVDCIKTFFRIRTITLEIRNSVLFRFPKDLAR